MLTSSTIWTTLMLTVTTFGHGGTMERLLTGAKTGILRLWREDRALTGTAGLMLLVLALALAGLALDPRTITGAPAWLKPAKFAASIAIYTLTTAWIFTYLPGWGRTRR